MKSKITFSVAPRYTPGSPAMVDEWIARRVAEEEKVELGRALAGVYGPEEKLRAEQLGNAGIVEACWEEFRPAGWLVQDMLTGEIFFRHADRGRKGPSHGQRSRAVSMLRAWQGRSLVDWTGGRDE